MRDLILGAIDDKDAIVSDLHLNTAAIVSDLHLNTAASSKILPLL